MDLPIEIFEVMADIARENGIRSVKWARASGIEPSRIFEYRRMAKLTEAGATESDVQFEVYGSNEKP